MQEQTSVFRRDRLHEHGLAGQVSDALERQALRRDTEQRALALEQAAQTRGAALAREPSPARLPRLLVILRGNPSHPLLY